MSNKFLDDADAADPETALTEPLLQFCDAQYWLHIRVLLGDF